MKNTFLLMLFVVNLMWGTIASAGRSDPVPTKDQTEQWLQSYLFEGLYDSGVGGTDTLEQVRDCKIIYRGDYSNGVHRRVEINMGGVYIKMWESSGPYAVRIEGSGVSVRSNNISSPNSDILWYSSRDSRDKVFRALDRYKSLCRAKADLF